MATDSPLYGKLMLLRRNGTAITNLRNSGLQQPRATRDVTTKDSNDEGEIRPTIKGPRTIGFDGIVSNSASGSIVGVSQFADDYNNGNVIVWKLGTGTTGDPYWTGSGFLTKFDISAPHDGNVEFSGEITTTGAVTHGRE